MRVINPLVTCIHVTTDSPSGIGYWEIKSRERVEKEFRYIVYALEAMTDKDEIREMLKRSIDKLLLFNTKATLILKATGFSEIEFDAMSIELGYGSLMHFLEENRTCPHEEWYWSFFNEEDRVLIKKINREHWENLYRDGFAQGYAQQITQKEYGPEYAKVYQEGKIRAEERLNEKKNNPDFTTMIDEIIAENSYQSAYKEKEKLARAALKHEQDIFSIAKMTGLTVEQIEQLQLQIQKDEQKAIQAQQNAIKKQETMILKLLEMNVSVDQIAQATNVSIDEIKKLQK